MSAAPSLPTDLQIVAVLVAYPSGEMTYVVKNRLRSDIGFRGLKTDWVRRCLQRLEREGYVERVRPNYAGPICWRATAAGRAAASLTDAQAAFLRRFVAREWLHAKREDRLEQEAVDVALRLGYLRRELDEVHFTFTGRWALERRG